MLSVSEVRKILDEIAVEVGIQKIDEMTNHCHVFYKMAGSESYFMDFMWKDDTRWRVKLADAVIADDVGHTGTKIWTTGNMTIYPTAFETYAVNIIRDRLNGLIVDYNKARKEMKLKEILNAGDKYELV